MEIPFMIGFVLVVLVLFVTEIVAIDLIAISIPIVLVIVDAATPMNLLTPEEAIAGFANPAVITIAMMFVLSAGLIRTGAVNGIGRGILHASSGNQTLALFYTMIVVSALSAFVNNTPIVVIFLPIILQLARQFEVSPSKLLIPLSFASIFGGTCTLIGTSTNLVVDAVYKDHGYTDGLGMFEFAKVGIPLGLIGIVYLLVIGRWLLPSRATITAAGGDNFKEYVTEVQILAGSPLIGEKFAETFIAKAKGVRTLEVIRGEEILWPPLDGVVLAEGDLLLVKGDVNELLGLGEKDGLEIAPELANNELLVSPRETTLAELVVSPNSRMIGQRVRDVGFHKVHDVAVIAVQRRGVHLRRKVSELVLRFGDILLVQGTVEAMQGLRHGNDFLLLEGVADSIVRPQKAPIALAILVGIIAIVTTGALDIMTLSMAGAVLMIATGCVPLREAYRSVALQVLVVIAGTLALGKAMETTQTAEVIVDVVGSWLQPLGAAGALSAVYFITMVLTSLISNTAAAVLMVPIALSMAASFGVSDPRAFVFAVAFGASACFATPLGYQTNLLVYGPGGYRFADFVRVGLPINLLFWAVVTFLIPVFWPLQ